MLSIGYAWIKGEDYSLIRLQRLVSILKIIDKPMIIQYFYQISYTSAADNKILKSIVKKLWSPFYDIPSL